MDRNAAAAVAASSLITAGALSPSSSFSRGGPSTTPTPYHSSNPSRSPTPTQTPSTAATGRTPYQCYSPACPTKKRFAVDSPLNPRKRLQPHDHTVLDRQLSQTARPSALPPAQGWEREPKCLSPACRMANRMSYWRHPKLRKLMMRAKISCALRLKPPLIPYSSFVPRALHNYLIQLSARTSDEVPFGTLKAGAVLFADASGFTALTERLSRKVSVQE